MNLLDIAFYEEKQLTTSAAILQRHNGSWEHYQYLDPKVKVTIIKFCSFEEEVEVNRIRFIFCPLPPIYMLSLWLRQLKKKFPADIIITHSLQFPWPTRVLKSVFSEHCLLLLQLHGDRTSGNPLKSILQRFVYFKNFSYLITGKNQLLPFYKAGVLRSDNAVFELMEGSSSFEEQPIAKKNNSILHLLSVCRLIEGKDPFTLIKAAGILAKKNYPFSLSIISSSQELLADVKSEIKRQGLETHIQLLAGLDSTEMQKMYRQSDIFISASLHEGSGWALCEAMSCGVPTLVSDIPAHRYMTGNGASGGLFPTGDAECLAKEIERIQKVKDALGETSRKLFETHLSFQAIAKGLDEIIHQLQTKTKSDWQ